jgi:hypothetical protein
VLPNPFDSGKLEKMIIQALTADEPPEVSSADEDKYMVQVNPESYRINYQINYSQEPAHGNSGSEARYANSAPPVLEFEFLFDGTGVIPAPAGPLDNVPIAGAIAGLFSGAEEYDVSKELQKFAHVVYDYSGTEHRPRQIRLVWGTLSFDGVLSSLTIDYKLFKPDGSPLRAVARATFDGRIADQLRELRENNNSPDLTHLRTTIAGDKLPLMAHKVYRTPNYYLEVARANKLFSFRDLKEGVQISFPPLDKQAK